MKAVTPGIIKGYAISLERGAIKAGISSRDSISAKGRGRVRHMGELADTLSKGITYSKSSNLKKKCMRAKVERIPRKVSKHGTINNFKVILRSPDSILRAMENH